MSGGGCRCSSVRFEVTGFGFWGSDFFSRFRCSSFCIGVSFLGCRVSGFGIRVMGSGFGITRRKAGRAPCARFLVKGNEVSGTMSQCCLWSGGCHVLREKHDHGEPGEEPGGDSV